MSEEKHLTLPVLGMTCANCVAAVERNAKKVDGVNDAVVNFASEKVTVSFDPNLADPKAIIERIHRAGYEVPTASSELPIIGMTCANCVNNVQRALMRVEGVLDVNVNYANEKATVKYIVGVTRRPELVASVRKAGYDVVEAASKDDVSEDELEDAEAAARKAEIRHQQKRLIVGIIFSTPLLILSMARDFGLLRPGDPRPILRWKGLLRRRL
jgi:Cu+-exporting ATPase